MTPQLLDNTLYDAFGQAEVSTIYTQLNQYYVVMEVAPKYWQSPEGLKDTYLIPNTGGGAIPLGSVVKYVPSTSPLAVNHTGLFPSVTVSFNLAPGVSLGQATQEIQQIQQKLGMPQSIHGQFSGTLQAFQQSLTTEPYLILTAILAVYIVLGILYESLIHPITILSTLPPASVGAILALMLTKTELDVMSIIGIILLIGIVKKNAIMMIDFALNAERNEGKNTQGLDLRSLHAALPSDHDDHHGGAVRRGSAGDRDGHGIGTAPAAGNFDYRRPDCQPGSDALHHAGHLSVHGQSAAEAARR